MKITAADLSERLNRVPRVRLLDGPTPLESWDRVAQAWRPGSRILAKRDDLAGPGLGGNKTRQLEYILGRAIADGCDVVVHGGALQSNYCRLLAAASARLGVECRLVLSTHYDQPADTGSHLLTRLFGAHIETTDLPLGAEHEALKSRRTEELRAAGRTPYLITYPHSEVLGSLGYVAATLELTAQLNALDRRPSVIVTSAVGASYAGMLLGLRLLGDPTPVVGITPLAAEYDIAAGVRAAITAAADTLGVDEPETDVDLRFDQVGPGYAVPSDAGTAALLDIARHEGVLLDLVYSGKAAAGLRELLDEGETALFLHTGGVAAVFAYAEHLTPWLDGHRQSEGHNA